MVVEAIHVPILTFCVIIITMTNTSCVMAIPLSIIIIACIKISLTIAATINELIDILEKVQSLDILNTTECTDLLRELCTDRS